ncbi:5-formyltetrahydrofolate cyclo-ligase [Planctomycetota bacterium]|nr:5-formyltetrahydrofolate cyclo-ligase [Planctomycetota bacterium]
MTEADERKRLLRGEYRRRRRLLPPMEKAAEAQETASVCRMLLDTLASGRPWPPVGSYMATPEELDLSPLHLLIWDAGQPLWLPRIQGPGRLEWYPVRHGDEVRVGTLNLCEPDPGLVKAEPLPEGIVLFTPGVAFTSEGRRLGMGGGYYDRVLTDLPDLDAMAIGVGFTCQLCDDLPTDEHDRTVDVCILGGDLIHCRTGLRPMLGLPPG